MASVICVAGSLGMTEAAFAFDAVSEAKTAGGGAPDDFLKAYYCAMNKAAGPKDIEPFMATVVKEKMKPVPEEVDLGPLFAEMIHQTHPAEVKIDSKREEAGRVLYDLSPVSVPKACADMAKDKSFSMKGSAVLVKEDGLWKVYKDYWVAEAKNADGNMRMAFGTDPDKKSDVGPGGNVSSDDSPGSPSEKADYSDRLRDYLMSKFKHDGSGKQIYIALKVSADGTVSDLNVGGEKPQKEAEEKVRALFASVQPLPALPAEMASKPYAWMMFDWQDNGGICISGPYFQENIPDWVSKKIGSK
jgi:hypothetical protein